MLHRNITPVQRRIEQMRTAQRYEENQAKRDAATPRVVTLFISIEALVRTLAEAFAVEHGVFDRERTTTNHDRMQAYLGGLDLPH